MEEVCAVGQLHQSDQVEVQADEIPQQVAAAEINIPYFKFKMNIVFGLVSTKITVGIAILVGWAGR